MNYPLIKNQLDYWTSICIDNTVFKKDYYVLGYTKTGTNWIRNLIRHYLEIDQTEVKGKNRSFLRTRVHHLHRFLPFGFYKKKLVYMTRDGRDAIVSRYFTMINQSIQSTNKRAFIKYSDAIPTKENIKELLPTYIKFLTKHHNSTIDYKAHVNKAISEKMYIVTYENLMNNTEETLASVIKHLHPSEVVDFEKIKSAVEYSSFNASKKRQSKGSGFFRKDGGKSGNWKKYFTLESAQVFSEYSNDVLIKMGYEKDANWVREFS